MSDTAELPSPRTAARAAAPSTILYVDRDPEATPVVRRFLERCRPRSRRRVARRGAAGRSTPLRRRCFVLDPELADGDGLDLVHKARVKRTVGSSLHHLRAARLVADSVSFIAAGAADLGVKPCAVGTLVARATRLIRAAEAAKKEHLYRRELESRLAHAERIATLGTLCATVAHEVANPLSLILTNAPRCRA